MELEGNSTADLDVNSFYEIKKGEGLNANIA